jgi:hypothetical protein
MKAERMMGAAAAALVAIGIAIGAWRVVAWRLFRATEQRRS